jgi:hypothetical protein
VVDLVAHSPDITILHKGSTRKSGLISDRLWWFFLLVVIDAPSCFFGDIRIAIDELSLLLREYTAHLI